MKISKGEIVHNCFYRKPKKERVSCALNYLSSREFQELSEDGKKKLIIELTSLQTYFDKMFGKNNSTYSNFEKNSKDFMNMDFPFDFDVRVTQFSLPPQPNFSQLPKTLLETSSTPKTKGRKKKPFDQKKIRSKYGEMINVVKFANENYELLMKAAIYAAQKHKKFAIASSIKNILNPLKEKKVKKVSLR